MPPPPLMVPRRATSACTAAALSLAACQPTPTPSQPWSDPTAHDVSYFTVAPDVNLEVLDWGGSGPHLVFLPGLGNTAHAFDDFAPRFLDRFHVVGITRRGFGASSHPDSGYDVATLAQDVSSVLEAMQLDPVILVGHSIAATELTEIGSRDPSQVERLVYLDTYCTVPGTEALMMALFGSPPEGMPEPVLPSGPDTLTAGAYVEFVRRNRGVNIPEADTRARYAADGWDETRTAAYQEVLGAAMSYPGSCENVQVPALTVISRRDSISQEEPWIRADTAAWAAQEEFERHYGEITEMVLDRFPQVIPGARAEAISGGHHWVFASHPDQVERLIRDFLR